MGKWGLRKGVSFLSVLLSVSVLPVCSGAACCTLKAKVFRLALVSITSGMQEPPPASAQTGARAAHKVKVWTNEELIATRTPADLYIFQKEAQAAALEVERFHTLASCFASDQPEGNVEETQKEIDATLQSIRDSEDAVGQSRTALSNVPEHLKLRNQLELSQRRSELNHARERLWALQEHLQELQKSPAQSGITSQPTPERPPTARQSTN
jgi:small-conductance mechanosensitive channel